jgi:tetratricopeptide (TPR) repeat protein
LTKAESALLKAVAMAPSTSRYRNNLGLVLGHQHRYDEALEAFRHAGSEADAQYNLAFIRASQNDMHGAKSSFREALVADPTFEPAREMLENFERIETDPRAEYENEPLVQGGVHWVPYVESGGSGASAVQASFETAASSAAMPATGVPASRTVAARNLGQASMAEPGRLSPATTSAAPLQ